MRYRAHLVYRECLPLPATMAAFRKAFPATLLRFDIESSAVMEPVLDGRCAVGVIGCVSDG